MVFINLNGIVGSFFEAEENCGGILNFIFFRAFKTKGFVSN
jgi:hypothetical protein